MTLSSTPRHSVSVAAAVVDSDRRVLAIRRRDNSKWEPPGGVLELEETIHEGLVREVQEETGLTVEPGELTGVYKNLERGIVALVFHCHAPVEAPSSSREAVEVRWLHPDEVRSYMDEAYAVRVLDALNSSPPAVRAHDGVSLQPSTE